MKKTILFIPSNPSHVATQMPVAEELLKRGNIPLFLSRDYHIEKQYCVEPTLSNYSMPVVRYKSYYKTDENRIFPSIYSYLKFYAKFSVWLSNVGADAIVVCNDDAALFDRMAVNIFLRTGKSAFLIQESVRPAIRKISFNKKYKEQGAKGILQDILKCLAFRYRLGPFFRKGYAHSSVTMIFTAGEMFSHRLRDEGVTHSQIIVTGQPRLDIKASPVEALLHEKKVGSGKVLLFCNQPVKCSKEAQEGLFLDIVNLTDSMEGVSLIVKLHPRDPPESYWIQLLKPGQGRSLIDITRSSPVIDCFKRADAFITITSTTCLEAMEYGLPVGLIEYLPIEWYLPYSSLNAVISVKSYVELRHAIEMLLFDESVRNRLHENAENVLIQELYLRDGKSATRICDHIEQIIA